MGSGAGPTVVLIPERKQTHNGGVVRLIGQRAADVDPGQRFPIGVVETRALDAHEHPHDDRGSADAEKAFQVLLRTPSHVLT